MTNKRMRHLKKWIPTSIYCDGCRMWHDITDTIPLSEKRKLCNSRHKKPCKASDEECEICFEGTITYCAYLKHREIGQYPLGDRCKICGVRKKFTSHKERISSLQYNMDRYLEKEAYQNFIKHCKNKYVKRYAKR